MLDKILEFLFKTFPLKLGTISIRPSILQAIAIVVLLFLLTFSLARLRRLYVDWSLKGAFAMVSLGFFLALIFEGFLILGGRTLFTEVVGWDNAPKPIATVINVGRDRLVEVLGVTQEVPSTNAKSYSSEDVFSLYQALPASEKASFENSVCSF